MIISLVCSGGLIVLLYTLVGNTTKTYEFNKEKQINFLELTAQKKKIVDKIKQNKVRLEKIKEESQSSELGIPDLLILKAEEEIRLIAQVNEIIKRIKKDPKWYADVKKQALERKLSEEKMLLLSAKYILKKRNNE